METVVGNGHELYSTYYMKLLRFRFTDTLKWLNLLVVPAGIALYGTGAVVPVQAQLRRVPVMLQKKCSQVNTIAVLPVKFDCYHLTSGGIREYSDAMSCSARQQIARQIERILTKKGYTVQSIPDEQVNNDRWARLRHFYSVVNREIQRNYYAPGGFPEGQSRFTYSLPRIPDTLTNRAADAFLFVDGFDDRATEKRKKRAVGAAIGAAITGVLLGVYVTNPVPADRTFASCALVNRWGEVIWYHLHTTSGKFEMADKHDAGSFLQRLFNRFELRREVP